MDWLNEPPEWRDEGGVLTVVTGEKTDFWRSDALRVRPR